MFRGNHPTRVDEKGRLKVPAEFKRVIDEKYAQKFYITSLDGIVAQVYPFEEWERIEQKLAGAFNFQSDQEEISDAHELLRTSRRDGRAGAPAGSADFCVRQRRFAAKWRCSAMLNHLEVRNAEAFRQGDRRAGHLRMTTRRRSTNWASRQFGQKASTTGYTGFHGGLAGGFSGGFGIGFKQHPRAGWAWGGWPCPGSFKRSDRFFSRKAWRNLSGCHGGPGRAQLGNRKTPRRTGTFDWLR